MRLATLGRVGIGSTLSPVVVAAQKEGTRAGSLATSDTANLLPGSPGFSAYSGSGMSGWPALRGLADDLIKVRIDGAETVSVRANHMNPI